MHRGSGLRRTDTVGPVGLKPHVVNLVQAQAWWEKVRLMHEAAPLSVVRVPTPWGEKWKVDTVAAPRCSGRVWGGRPCPQMAGERTGHMGVGACRHHSGNSIKGMTEGFMIMAHGLSDPEKIRATNISPPQALLEEVNRTMNAVRWLDEKIASATSDEQLVKIYTGDEDGVNLTGELEPFVKMWQSERAHLARVSIAAVTAKAQEIMDQRYEAHGNVLRAMLHDAMELVIGDVVAGRVPLDAGLTLYASEILDGRIVEMSGVGELTESPVDSQ